MKFSIVTPSFNQREFLSAAMRSVLDQPEVKLEYLVLDGGSTDGSVEIIQAEEKRISYWRSAPDGGQYAAIQEGFERSSGEIMAWLNSDDQYVPWALSIVAEIFAQLPEVEWLTTRCLVRWDERDRAARCLWQTGYSRAGFFRGENLPEAGAFSTGWIQQESTFWRRSLWERTGGRIDTQCKLAGDFDLWARFFQKAELYSVETPLGGFRFHGAQKTGRGHDSYLDEARAILSRYRGRRYGPVAKAMRAIARACAPFALRPHLARFGLLHPCKVCRHDKHTCRWKIATTYE